MKYYANLIMNKTDTGRISRRTCRKLMQMYMTIYNLAAEEINEKLPEWNKMYDDMYTDFEDFYSLDDNKYDEYISKLQDEVLKKYDNKYAGLIVRSNPKTCAIEGFYENGEASAHLYFDIEFK